MGSEHVASAATVQQGASQNRPTQCRCGAELVQPTTGRPRFTCSDDCRRAEDAKRKRERRRLFALPGDEPEPELPAEPASEAEGLRAAAEALHSVTRPIGEREEEAGRLVRRWGYQLVAWGPLEQRQYRFVRS